MTTTQPTTTQPTTTQPTTKKTGRRILTVIGVLFLAAVLVAAAAVYFYGPAVSAMTTGKARFLGTDSPKRYTATLLQLAEQGIYSDSEEFAAASEHAKEVAEDADSVDDVRGALDDAIHAAGGKHSRLFSPEQVEQRATDAAGSTAGAGPAVDVNGGVAVATVPGVTRHADVQGYADTLAGGLSQARDGGACGAVVDPRGNDGGDMGPMLAGLSPVIPDGTAMEFVYSGRTMAVTVDGNSVSGGGTPLTTDGGKWDAPTAVLVDEETASSGEATMLAFRGLDNSRSFGVPTAGFASANTVYDFPDGSELMLTIAKDRDREGQTYAEEPIEPDAKTESGDTALAAAQKWLRDEHGCQ
ncbi:S41 family peptidase [Corynebacterium appendicis]|uniref:S41 family peptidase n=1 Tax=Corynebacterium appendicis TaxID=163202 RepID=UPI0023542B59|nr:S41 family peptidase [Corynebacterium appendicis]